MILYQTLVKGGWKHSICCSETPWTDGDHFFCYCDNAKALGLAIVLEVPDNLIKRKDKPVESELGVLPWD